MSISLTKSPLAYKKVQYFISHIVRGNRLGIRKNRLKAKQYLDVGCGYRFHDEFINLDYRWNPRLDICWDITKPIPLPDSSLKGIYTEHCLEHMALPTMFEILDEFMRMLMPGGTLRIIVPDGDLYVKTYIERMNGGEVAFPYESQDPHNGVYTPMMSLNRIFRKWGHQFIYDYETLNAVLADKGFTDIKHEVYMSGRDPNMLHDSESRKHESLYIEASKPI